MCLPPFSCPHPVVDTFVFLCPRVFLLCVRFLLLCHRCLFVMLICPFLMLPPVLLMLHGAGGTGEGHPFTRPDPFWCYPLCGTDFLECCACPFLMLHEAVSIHLHVSPSIFMSPSCCRHVCFLMPTGCSLMRAVSPFMPSVSFCYASLSFSYAAPCSSYAPRRRWDGGRGTLLQDPTFFGAILYAELTF